MNNRANIFYFIEHLCEQAQREGHLSYVNNIRRDIFRIVDAVAPSDGTGAANVKVVRKVGVVHQPQMHGISHTAQGLPKLEQLSVLTSETAAELDAALKERDTATHTAMVSPWTAAAEASSAAKDPGGAAAPTTTSKGNGFGKLDKRQIEQRIEEDRERHKRLKESLWSVSGDGYEEADKLWDEASDFGEDDILQAQEETAELMEITVDELEKKEGKFDFGTVRRI